MSFELVTEAFQQQKGHGGVTLSAWRCCIDDCKRVELSIPAILLHLAVIHGVRRIPEDRLKELREHGVQI